MDTVTKEKRSAIMARVRGKDTLPEMRVRRLVTSLGYRYRLHRRSLPGCPDLVFPSRFRVIFVHGCFWHRHRKCEMARIPKSRVAFWTEKLEGNRKRDRRSLTALRKLGWRVLVVWECELADEIRLRSRIYEFLEGTGHEDR